MVVPAAPTQVTLTTGGVYYPPVSPLYLHLFAVGGVNTTLVQNVIYTLTDADGITHTYAINGDNLMVMLT